MKLVFVITAPRMGSTITAELLGSHLLAMTLNEMPHWREIIAAESATKKTFVVKPTYLGVRRFDLLKDFPNAKFIIMKRNPRDTYASYKGHGSPKMLILGQFRHKGGFAAELKEYFEYIKKYENKDNCMFLQFEDLLTDTTRTTAKLLGFIGLELDVCVKEFIKNYFSEYPVPDYPFFATSTSKGNKIGRWHTDLTPEEIANLERLGL